MDVELVQKYAVIELKYDEGKVLTVRRKWILNPKQQYSKTDDVFCYWSNNLEDSPEELTKCEYSKTFTGEPALFKVFVVKLADSLAEAEKYMQGRLKFVSKKFREPGNTDEEIRKMQLKQRRSEKKELKSQKAEAHALNVDYLIQEIKLQAPSVSCGATSKAANNIVNAETNNISGDEGTVILKPTKMKKNKSFVPSKKIKYTKQNEAQKNELSRRSVVTTENLDESIPASSTFTTAPNVEEFTSFDSPIYGIEKEPYNGIDSDCLPKSDNCEIMQSTPYANTLPTKDLSTTEYFQQPPSTSGTTVNHLESIFDPKKNIVEEKGDGTKTISNSLESGLVSDEMLLFCEIPPTYLNELYGSILSDTYEYLESNQIEENIPQQSKDDLQSQFMIPETSSYTEPSDSQSPGASGAFINNNCVNPVGSGTSGSGTNIVVLNFDELTSKYNDAVGEVMKLKSENESLKTDLSKANRRNILLQDYLVAVDERVPEILFVEKDGGRLYRDNIFLTKTQCAVLDKAKTDNEYINNLLVCIFGRKVLSTHTLSGKRGKNKKDLNGQPSVSARLDRSRLSLIYDIMDARAVANKTNKLTKTEINAVITKKISNITTYAEKSLNKEN